MLTLRGSCFRILELAAILPLTAGILFSQTAASSASSALRPAAGGEQHALCAQLADTNIPVNSTVEAKIMGLDSAHLKPDKEIWFRVAHGVIYPGCTLDPDAVVYARVVSVASSKNPGSSELSLAFDRADCSGHDKQPFKLRLIAVVGPPDQTHHLHDAVPTEVAGGIREIDSTLAGTNGLDLELNPGGPPHTVHPGIVVGVPGLNLEPTAGPDCSDKLTSPKSKIQLGPGSELILAMTEWRSK